MSVANDLAAPVLSAAVALPGELWLVAGAAVWPLGAWLLSETKDLTGGARSRVFAGAAVSAVVVAGLLLAAAAWAFSANGSARGFQALAAMLGAGAALLGGLASGAAALALRRRSRGSDARRDAPVGDAADTERRPDRGDL